jgi:hypothetical protein
MTPPGHDTDAAGAMPRELDAWIGIAYTIMLAVIVPVYALSWGWRNFLWFSDIALVTTGIALWLRSSLLASMMAVAVLVPELFWCVGYFGRLIFGARITGLTDYMFDSSKSRFVRGLSLFHVVLPVVLLWLLHDLGYDRRALVAQTLVAWIVLPLTYAVTSPGDENINWVRAPNALRRRIPPLAWLAIVMLAFPAGLYVPTHVILEALFARSG